MMQAIRLKTEHLFNPIGVDFAAPRLFWNCANGKKQTAYQIIASDDKGNLLWDSGKVASASMRAAWGRGSRGGQNKSGVEDPPVGRNRRCRGVGRGPF